MFDCQEPSISSTPCSSTPLLRVEVHGHLCSFIRLSFLKIEWLHPPCTCQLLSLRKFSSIPVVPTNSWNGRAWRNVLTIQLFCLPRKALQSHSFQSPSPKPWVSTQLLLPNLNSIWDIGFCSPQCLQWSCLLPVCPVPPANSYLALPPQSGQFHPGPAKVLMMKSRAKHLPWTVGKQMRSWND